MSSVESDESHQSTSTETQEEVPEVEANADEQQEETPELE